MALSLVTAVIILALQLRLGLVPINGQIPMRWIVLVGPYLGLMAVVYLCYIWKAAWQEHERSEGEISALKVKAWDCARVEGASVMFKSACRLMQSLQGLKGVAQPLDPKSETDNIEVAYFRRQYQQHLLLQGASSLSVPIDPMNPMPQENSEASYEAVQRGFQAHIEWLRGCEARLSDHLATSPTIP
jgi:hypothetical protein